MSARFPAIADISGVGDAALMAGRALKNISNGMVVLALPAFCFSAVMIFGSFGSLLLFGFASLGSILALIAAVVLPFVCVFGPIQSRKAAYLPEWQRWVWVLSPAMPLAVLIAFMAWH